jgi:transposase-like protein
VVIAGHGATPLTEERAMAAGDITFVECPYGDSFPVRKTSSRSPGIQQIVCPRCGHGFEVMFEETVERLSRESSLSLVTAVTRFA